MRSKRTPNSSARTCSSRPRSWAPSAISPMQMIALALSPERVSRLRRLSNEVIRSNPSACVTAPPNASRPTRHASTIRGRLANVATQNGLTMSDQSRPAQTRRFPSDDRLIVGRLESHGPANYQFRADQSPSYYLKVVTNRGFEVLWGKDLARALAESRAQPKIGSVIGVRRSGYQTLTIPERRDKM